MAVATIAAKDFRLLLRDYRAAVILLAMPVVFMLVLGVALGEGFGQKPDNRLRVSVVILDRGPPTGAAALPVDAGPPAANWAEIVERDLRDSAGINVEVIPDLETAQRLVRRGERSAVLVFGPNFSACVDLCSFNTPKSSSAGTAQPPSKEWINPFFRDGVDFAKLDITVEEDPTQKVAASIIKQVAQVSMMRVVLPWMIGRAFEDVTRLLPLGASRIITAQFSRFDLTAKTWSKLTKSPPGSAGGGRAILQFDDTGFLNRGAARYQILVPSLTVMFAFFLVLTAGGLFVGERRQGTLVRLRVAPLARWQILAGKLLPCLTVSLVQGFLLLIAGKFVFGMSWGSHPGWLFAVAACTSLAATGLAVLIAGLARTEAQVAVYGTLLVMVLAGVSGCLMPRDLMPEAMKTWSLATPHAWALEAYNQLLLNPHPEIGLVAYACGVLATFGLVFLLLGWWRLRLD